ncbi:MAG: hypothetical protein IE937_07100 [Gammaproteobacteria bacterium]|jgi:ABC-type transporter MlaC component|nr:hypothetical protein [Gammaproteobacteria bacterium]MBD3775957.1 hypothetical protein [Thiotrichales bacterium]
MKHLTLKALFVSAFAVASLNVQAADDVYSQCLADAEHVIATAKKEGGPAARKTEQKTTVEQCFGELNKIEAKYGDKTKGVNPSSVMTPEDRAKWSALFDAIDAKKFTGTRYNMASYYR